MFMEERHQAILEHLAQHGRITIGEIQEKFAVSLDSARRDLRILEEKQQLKRTHGGAIPLQKINRMPPRERDMHAMPVYPNYDAIAKRAAAMVSPEDVLYITSGSLGFLMLRHLPREFHYTVVVNSVLLANEIKLWENVDVYIVGGKMRNNGTGSIVDNFAVDFIKTLQLDLCFMTGAGLDADFGLSNNTKETATFQAAAVAQARKAVALAPHQKLGFRAFMKVCDAAAFDLVITDWDAVEEQLLALEEKGVEVIVVQKEE